MQKELNSTGAMRNVAGVFLLALIMTVTVFAADLLFLLPLDLLKNVETLISVLFYEGFALMLVGAAGWGFGEHEFFVLGWRRAKIYHVSKSPRYPNFWLSVALAGLFLIFIDLYLFHL